MRRSSLALAVAVASGIAVVAPAAGAPEQTPKRGGTFVQLRPPATEPACLNPFACNVSFNDPILTQVLDGAFEVGSDLVPRENLVEAVDIGQRKPFTLTYHIRPEARWSDGTPVTARDFLFTQQTFASRPTVFDPGGERLALHRKVQRASVLGRKTFRIVLREPTASWRSLYSLVLPRHVLAGRDVTRVWADGINDPETGTPIGSGPFLVRSWDRGDAITLVRNPAYWGPHTAYLDRFVWRFLRQDPADPLAPVRQDEFHGTLSLGGAFIDEKIAADIRAMPGWKIESWPSTGHEHLSFRVQPQGHPALESRAVRQALAFGIDRVEIARRLLAGLPRLARPLDSTAFLPSEQFYRPNWRGYRYDPTRARRLLEGAGCRRGADGIYECGERRMRLRLVTTAGTPARTRTLELVTQQLRRVGVEIAVQYAPNAALFNQIVTGGDFDMVLFAWVTHGGVVAPEARCGHPQSWGGYCSRLATNDARAAERILDPVRRARVLNAADAKLARGVPVIPLYQNVLRAAIRTSVRGVVPGGSQFELTENSEDWWLADPR